MARHGERRSRVSIQSLPTARELILVGANHRTCPMGERERLLRVATYPRLRKNGGSPPSWEDLVLLTTCNRIEVYALAVRANEAVRAIRTALEVPEGDEMLYELRGPEAAAHLLRVASGLDSLAQGETQVAAQVRRAPSQRPRSEQRSAALALLFERAAHAAARIHQAADLGASEASASHAALRFIEATVHLPKPTVALLGSGKMARIAAGSLRGRARILVVNRDPRRAREVARTLGGRGTGLEDLDAVLEAADVVLAATASRKPLISAARLRRVMSRRPGRPACLVDLGFPRNIAPACRDLAGVTLVDIDALAPWGAQPLPPAALARAEAQIRSEAERLIRSLGPSAATDIASLRRSAEELRRREVEEAFARLPGLTDADRAVVDKLATRLVNRFLHGPTERLRSSPEALRSELIQELLRGIGGPAR